ncbi:hypothetical protein Xszus_02479 [Xenorhabdus szentirmaii]|nr:hypothetical protein Xsze_00383 [Xenorhabdus szentirmaii DSM 16338]PHM42735.1 hypothetical protein Xszus_02479 [Xenorhabdus szentirmaii]
MGGLPIPSKKWLTINTKAATKMILITLTLFTSLNDLK